MKKLAVLVCMSLLLTQGLAFAQEAPPPRKSPRTPVNQQALPDRKPAPASRNVQGQATVIDSDKLRIGDTDLRLFGIVAPQLSASFGPQARAALDNLVNGQQVNCLIRDRDHDGRFLATCQAGNTDLALELLRRGLAVTARGSLASTDLSPTYIAAEQAAQAQKSGLWATVTPAAATISAIPAKVEPPKVEVAKAEPPKSEAALVAPPPAPPVEAKKEEKAAAKKAAEPNIMPPLPLAASDLEATDDEAMVVPETTGFFARYQLLITGLLMLVTALSILAVISSRRRNEKRDEMKAIAAALRGELMAARAVCQARIKTVNSDADEKAMSWPRIRVTLYQAYVGRLGWLGAELARQVASIYGQSSDYAAYYNGDETRAETTPKKQALQNLVQHIEEVLPKLAMIEQTGKVASGQMMYVSTSSPLTSARNPVPVAPAPLPEFIESVSVSEPVEPVAGAEVKPAPPPPASAPSSPPPSSPPLWDTVRQFRERFVEKKPKSSEEADYAAIIEAEMAGVSFVDEVDESETPTPANPAPFRDTGS